MADREYLSIGDVLALLKVEFSDVTISKIRFLESQGLVQPERTPSGYRKFFGPDVARLRWVLRQQRENFLPLKVIKERLEEGLTIGPNGEELDAPAPAEPEMSEAAELLSNGVVHPGSDPTPTLAFDDGLEPSGGKEAREAKEGDRVTLLEAGADPDAPVVAEGAPRLSRRELARAVGLTEKDIDTLEQYGLIHSEEAQGVRTYGPEARTVAGLAVRFGRYGLEARHLRAYRSAVDREVNLYGQAVSSLLKMRNPQARSAAEESLAELTRLGGQLRSTLLAEAIEELRRA